MRRYKTAKARRAKTYRQLVLPTPGGLTREVAFRYKHKKRAVRSRNVQLIAQKRKSRTKKPALAWNTARPQAILAATFIVIGLSGISWFGVQIAQGHKLEPMKTFSSPPPVKAATAIKALPRSQPTHISVPSVGIDAPVAPVGQDANGSIEMPALFDWTTGWYNGSPTPGQTGPSIIVGHVDTYKGVSVFWRLRDVQRGDIINVSRADGRTVKFKVTALKQFDQSNFPTDQVYGNISYPGLRLITCGGAFNQQTESYTQNTVVYAFMVS